MMFHYPSNTLFHFLYLSLFHTHIHISSSLIFFHLFSLCPSIHPKLLLREHVKHKHSHSLPQPWRKVEFSICVGPFNSDTSGSKTMKIRRRNTDRRRWRFKATTDCYNDWKISADLFFGIKKTYHFIAGSFPVRPEWHNQLSAIDVYINQTNSTSSHTNPSRINTLPPFSLPKKSFSLFFYTPLVTIFLRTPPHPLFIELFQPFYWPQLKKKQTEKIDLKFFGPMIHLCVFFWDKTFS